MRHRVLVLLRARLASRGPGGGVPVAAWLSQGLVAAVACGLVRGELPPFAYATLAFSIVAAMVAIPLIGELGYLLRADPAATWVGSLPVRPIELKLARTAHLLVVLGGLALGGLVPAALLATDVGLLARLALVAEGLGVVLALAAALLTVQAFFGGRAEPVLLLVQTVLVVGVVVGLVAGMRYVPVLLRVESFADAPMLRLFPPAWFAAPHAAGASLAAALLPIGASLAALAVLAAIPPPAPRFASARPGWLELLLLPVRAFATRWWLRADERAPFDLAYDALPREREVVLRTVPLIGIPLAFLAIAVLGEPGAKRDGLLALLLFTPGIYLPVLLSQIPVSASWRAGWLLATAPVSPQAIANGTLKALAVRFLVPLYLVLGLLAWQQSDLGFALRIALPGGFVTLFVMRLLYPTCVTAQPLSVPPDEAHADMDWGGGLMVVAIALAVVAVLAEHWIGTIGAGLAATALLVLVEWSGDRRLRAAG